MAMEITPSNSLAKALQSDTGISLSACYQCKKCTNGCPVNFAMDRYPHQVIRLAQLGQEEIVLNCRTIWLCSACETCSTRCPNEIDIAGVMDYLKQRAIRRQVSVPAQRTLAFHQAFMDDIRRRGRICEPRLMLGYFLRGAALTGDLFSPQAGSDMRLGWQLLKRRRMQLLPRGVKGKQAIKKILE